MKIVTLFLFTLIMSAQTPTKSAPPDAQRVVQTDGITTSFSIFRTDAPAGCFPMVVAAVEEEYGNPGFYWCDILQCVFSEGTPMTEGSKVYRRKRPTCADKRRVLVTTEDHVSLCLLLPEPPKESK